MLHCSKILLQKGGCFLCAQGGETRSKWLEAMHKIDWISTSGENLDRHIGDLLCGFHFKLGGTCDVVRILMEVGRKAWTQKAPQDFSSDRNKALPLIFFAV